MSGVGTYACVRNKNNSNYSAGATISGQLSYGSNGDGWYSENLSGTWRVMGQVRSNDNNNEGKSTVMLRIS